MVSNLVSIYFDGPQHSITFYYLVKFHYLIAFTSSKIGQLCIKIVSKTGCDVIFFEINLIFLIKSRQKI